MLTNNLITTRNNFVQLLHTTYCQIPLIIYISKINERVILDFIFI